MSYSYTVIFTEEADNDVFGARIWYESRRIGLGDELIDEIEEYVNVLEKEPPLLPHDYFRAKRQNRAASCGYKPNCIIFYQTINY